MRMNFFGILVLAMTFIAMGCGNPWATTTPSPTPSLSPTPTTPKAISFSGLSANGTSGSATTTVLTLSFDADPTTLSVSDITLTGATKDALAGTGTSRTLAISNVTVANGADLTLAIANPAGYSISPASRTVAANVDAALTPVVFSGLSANGTSGAVTTTFLTLSFDADPTTLSVSDITLTGATKGALAGTGTSRTLAISNVTVANGADLTLAIANPAGYSISPASRNVAANYFSLYLAMVDVAAGTFQRDATSTNTSYVSAFKLGQYEVTRAQFLAVMGTDPSDAAHSTGTDDPAQRVNWYQAIAFCNKLSLAEGLRPVYGVTVSGAPVDFAALAFASIPTSYNGAWSSATADWTANGYRLPTEMEWMWAAMGATGGTTGYAKPFAGSTGGNAIGDCAVYGLLSSTGHTEPVGGKLPNELVIYDMSGNVWEWCWDSDNTTGWPAYNFTGPVSDYRGQGLNGNRVIRGGGWTTNTTYCAVAGRMFDSPEDMYNVNGLRVARY
jgi:formylglycine-generating enzyme required for sulfatase activity